MRPIHLPYPTAPRARSLLGFALLLAVLSPLILWRAQLETSLWMDETYSLLLVSHPVERLVAITGLDSHPPGYYLALKAWLKAGRLLGLEPGVGWARLSGVLLWALLAALAWWGGRRLLGRAAGTLLAWTVAGGAGAALMARELRGYGATTLCLFAAFLVLVAVSAPPAGGHSRRTRRALWAGYALAATLALWSHLLAALALAAASLAWLATAAARGRLGQALTPYAIAGHLAPIVLFSPWLVRVARQIELFERSGPGWMTPPTAANLGWVFAFWYPFSRIGDPTAPGNAALVPLGLAAALAPFLLGLWALLRRARVRVREATEDPLLPSAAIGLGGSVLFVAALWLLTRAGLVHVFHGPRYPLLAVHLWSAGSAALAALAARSLARPAAARWIVPAVLACLPWLAASAVGQARMANAESWGEVSEVRAAAGAAWPRAGERLYVTPSELLPFYRRTLAGIDVRRIERLPCDRPDRPVRVLHVNPWPQVDRPRDHLVEALVARGTLGPVERVAAFPPDWPSYVLTRVGPSPPESDGLLAELCRLGLAPPLHGRLAAAASAAPPEDQLGEGWSYLEVSPELDLYRWATAARVRAVFDRPVAPGRYVLHLVGARAPRADGALGVALPGAGERTVTVPAGRFHLCFDVVWPAEAPARPVLGLEHPLWRRPDSPADPADRALGVLFHGAWLEAAEGSASGATAGCAEVRELGAGSGRRRAGGSSPAAE